MIKVDESGISITGDSIEWYRQQQIARGLALEIVTGMKMSRGVSLVKLANAVSGSKARTKRDALAALVAEWPSVPASVVRALSK